MLGPGAPVPVDLVAPELRVDCLDKFSEQWSYVIGDAARQGFPLRVVSGGFQKLTLFPKRKLLGRKCGAVLSMRALNPEWLRAEVNGAIDSVISGRTEWADFLLVNKRANQTTFSNYVRVTMINTLTGYPNMDTAGLMFGSQVDCTDLVGAQEFQNEHAYSACLKRMRQALPWPPALRSCEITLRLAAAAQQSRCDLPACDEDGVDVPWDRDALSLPAGLPAGSDEELSVASWACAATMPDLRADLPRDLCTITRARQVHPRGHGPGARHTDWRAANPGRAPTGRARQQQEVADFEPKTRLMPSLASEPASRASEPSDILPSTATTHFNARARGQGPCLQRKPEEFDTRVFVIEYRHTNSTFQPHLLAVEALKVCHEPRHVPGGPLVFIRDPDAHAKAWQHASSYMPRHVLCEEALLGALTLAAQGIPAGRGRRTNERRRETLQL